MSVAISTSCSDKVYIISKSDFIRLRQAIAYSANENFGNLYKELTSTPFHSDMFYLNFDIRVKRMIEAGMPSAVARFCLLNDMNGKLTADECKEMYEAVLQTNLNEKYGSVFREDTLSFEKFKELLLECGRENANLLWK